MYRSLSCNTTGVWDASVFKIFNERSSALSVSNSLCDISYQCVLLVQFELETLDYFLLPPLVLCMLPLALLSAQTFKSLLFALGAPPQSKLFTRFIGGQI